jgi:hypothetical protein
MPFGDGKIISQVGGTAADGLNNLTSVINNMFTFNDTYLLSLITSNMTKLKDEATKYATGQISDLDSTNNQHLSGFSNPSNSTNNANCAGFSSDSWVPSNSQITSDANYIPCKVSTGNVGDDTTCTSATFTNAPSQTCGGCMDTTKLLSSFTLQIDVVNAAKAKYGLSCNFAPVLGNVWLNYYSEKKS